MTEQTPKQIEILRHALGLQRSAHLYRNYFITGPGSDDYLNCEALVEAGLMVRREANALTGGDPVYYVTEAGKAVVMKEPTP